MDIQHPAVQAAQLAQPQVQHPAAAMDFIQVVFRIRQTSAAVLAVQKMEQMLILL
jgi:hypothetical protein